jgi:hypothetical protein
MSHQHALAEAFKKIKEKQGEGYKIGTRCAAVLSCALPSTCTCDFRSQSDKIRVRTWKWNVKNNGKRNEKTKKAQACVEEHKRPQRAKEGEESKRKLGIRALTLTLGGDESSKGDQLSFAELLLTIDNRIYFVFISVASAVFISPAAFLPVQTQRTQMETGRRGKKQPVS